MSQSLRRSARIIDEIARSPQTVSQLAKMFDLHRSTMFRELKAMEEIGFARRRTDGTYTLGMKLAQLGQRVLADIALREAAAVPVRRLQRITGNTVHVAALVGDDVVYVDKVEDESGVRMYSRIGAPVRVHCSGVGKAIAAQLSGLRRESLLAKVTWEKYTEGTITTPEEFDEELRVVKNQGWASDDREFEDFINCLALPIFGPHGVVGAISVTAIRMVTSIDELKEFIPLMTRVTQTIGHELR